MHLRIVRSSQINVSQPTEENNEPTFKKTDNHTVTVSNFIKHAQCVCPLHVLKQYITQWMVKKVKHLDTEKHIKLKAVRHYP